METSGKNLSGRAEPCGGPGAEPARPVGKEEPGPWKRLSRGQRGGEGRVTGHCKDFGEVEGFEQRTDTIQLTCSFCLLCEEQSIRGRE